MRKNIMYKKTKALCPDGKVRVIYHGEADTYFSAPAWTSVRGKYVSGYVTTLNASEVPSTMIPPSRLQFVPFSRNAYLIPDTLKTTKAILDRTYFNQLPPKYRWIWEV